MSTTVPQMTLTSLAANADTFIWQVAIGDQVPYPVFLQHDAEFRRCLTHFLDGQMSKFDYEYLARPLLRLEPTTAVGVFVGEVPPTQATLVYHGNQSVDLTPYQILSAAKASYATLAE